MVTAKRITKAVFERIPEDLYAPKCIPDIAELKKMTDNPKMKRCHRAMNAGNFSPTTCRVDCTMWNDRLGKCAERELIDMDSYLAYREIQDVDF